MDRNTALPAIPATPPPDPSYINAGEDPKSEEGSLSDYEPVDNVYEEPLPVNYGIPVLKKKVETLSKGENADNLFSDLHTCISRNLRIQSDKSRVMEVAGWYKE